jgi:hypothetical protein
MSHPVDANQRIANSLSRTAQLLSVRFSEGGSLNERHFEPVFEEALQADPLVRVLPGTKPKLTHWRKAYAIDTAALLPDGTKLVAELKWGVGKLYNCSWDLAKLGVVVAEGVADHAYLIAGAPANEWGLGRGAELFSEGEWTPQELLRRFSKHFAFWARDVPTTGPIGLPAAIQTKTVAVVPVTGWKDDWTLRASRVQVSDSTWVAWDEVAIS